MAASIESGNSASTADLATTKTGTATVSMGNTTGTFTVPVNDDSTDEDDQTFTVTLSDVWSNAQLAADPTAEGTIEDDDNPPTLTVADLRHDENTLLANVTVSLSEVSEKRVNFRLRQVDRTGDTASDADWNPRPAVFISFSAGTMSEESAAVSVVNDTLDEDDETLTVEAYGLDNATGSAADREATITIVDDVEFVVTLSAVSGRDVMVDYATSVATGDDAVSDTDFTSTSGTLTIAAADDTATGTIEVPTAEDTTVESSETFTLTISSPDNATLTTDTTATGTINNRATTAAEPTNFEAAVGNAQVVLSWDPPASDSGVTRHEYRFKTGTGSYPAMWEQIANSGVGGTNEDGFTVTSLTNEVLHTFQLRAVNAQGESAAAESDPVTPTPGICDRTQQVHELIVYYLEDSYGVERTCEEVNVADLERFTIALEMASENIGSLKSGDFAGLTNLNTLVLASNSFTTLPADVFSGLTSLRALVLDSGELSSIDARAFSGLTALEGIRLEGNDLDSLPGTVFSGLTSLTTLTLTNNDLTSLPAGVFSGLSALTTLSLSRNDLSSLPAGVFSGLSALTILTLKDNDLNSLPDGLFSGLTALTILRLDDNPNTDDKLPLTVTLEKVGADRVRAKVPAGAPFAVDIPVTPAAVTVDVDLSTQPTRPEFHQGYVFARAGLGPAGGDPAGAGVAGAADRPPGHARRPGGGPRVDPAGAGFGLHAPPVPLPDGRGLRGLDGHPRQRAGRGQRVAVHGDGARQRG